MVIKNVELEIVCGITSKVPDNKLPEIAFAGKSNVGKSSLINTMMNRKSLARISAQPGKTQTINFYNINHEMYLVDLPGYGFAKVPESERAKWGKMIEDYLHQSRQLKAVFLLVDIRHEPSDNDKLMYSWIVRHGYRPIIIATKMDKLKRTQVEKHVQQVRDALELKEDDILIPFSSHTGEGRAEVWRKMDELIGWKEPEIPQEAAVKRSDKNRWKKSDKKSSKKSNKKSGKKTGKKSNKKLGIKSGINPDQKQNPKTGKKPDYNLNKKPDSKTDQKQNTKMDKKSKIDQKRNSKTDQKRNSKKR